MTKNFKKISHRTTDINPKGKNKSPIELDIQLKNPRTGIDAKI